MTTAYALLLARCGLSTGEAARLHGVRPDTTKKWSQGTRSAHPDAIDELRALYRQIEHAATDTLAQMRRARPKPTAVELGLASDDHEAQQLGLPCVGAHEALLGLVAARIDLPVRIVPRGSTAATAAAIEAREGPS